MATTTSSSDGIGYGDDGTPQGGVFADLQQWTYGQLIPGIRHYIINQLASIKNVSTSMINPVDDTTTPPDNTGTDTPEDDDHNAAWYHNHVMPLDKGRCIVEFLCTRIMFVKLLLMFL